MGVGLILKITHDILPVLHNIAVEILVLPSVIGANNQNVDLVFEEYLQSIVEIVKWLPEWRTRYLSSGQYNRRVVQSLH